MSASRISRLTADGYNLISISNDVKSVLKRIYEQGPNWETQALSYARRVVSNMKNIVTGPSITLPNGRRAYRGVELYDSMNDLIYGLEHGLPLQEDLLSLAEQIKDELGKLMRNANNIFYSMKSRKTKKSVKRSRKPKKSVKRSRKVRKTPKRSRKVKKTPKRSRKVKKSPKRSVRRSRR